MKLLLISFLFLQLPKPISPPTPLTTITVPETLQQVLIQSNKDLEIARLKKENIILQIRLILQIPNDYEFNENLFEFKKSREKEIEKKELKH